MDVQSGWTYGSQEFSEMYFWTIVPGTWPKSGMNSQILATFRNFCLLVLFTSVSLLMSKQCFNCIHIFAAIYIVFHLAQLRPLVFRHQGIEFPKGLPIKTTKHHFYLHEYLLHIHNLQQRTGTITNWSNTYSIGEKLTAYSIQMYNSQFYMKLYEEQINI